MSTKYDNNFNGVDDLTDCLERGCEIEFVYKRKKYSITHITNNQIVICEFYKPNTEMIYQNSCDLLEYKIGNQFLKNILNEIKILSRSF